MTTYKDSGVDIEKGDAASKKAYDYAKQTFTSRNGMIGASASTIEGGFSGAHDMGDYLLVHNSDGVGTKAIVAQKMNKFDTLGYDLLAMVCDDAICVGAETFSITNTIDTNKVDPEVTSELLKGLSRACEEQKVIIAGGEIAELNTMVNGFTWNASCIGIVNKQRLINPADIVEGAIIVGLQSDGFRSNGMSLVRKILQDQFGEDWVNIPYEERTWGEVVLTPSRIYSACVLDMIGRYNEEQKDINIQGIAHITGGGITNLNRILKQKQFGAEISNPLPTHSFMEELKEMGKVSDEEAYRSWNMGMGMALVMTTEIEANAAIKVANQHGINAQIIGHITSTPGIHLKGMIF